VSVTENEKNKRSKTRATTIIKKYEKNNSSVYPSPHNDVISPFKNAITRGANFTEGSEEEEEEEDEEEEEEEEEDDDDEEEEEEEEAGRKRRGERLPR
jgi:hypothetical protein